MTALRLSLKRSVHKGVGEMKYLNAADILPDKLLREVQKYARGEALYIPMIDKRKKWGEGSGARSYYELRNDEIRRKYNECHDIDALAAEYNLAFETIRKIVYK